MKKSILIISALTLTSCASFKGDRNPSSTDTVLAEVLTQIKSTIDNRDCSANLDNQYKKLFELIGKSTYFDMDNIEVLDRDIQSSFETRLALKESIPKLDLSKTSEKNCFNSIANLTKALRYVEDYMIEMRIEKTETTPLEYINMKGEFPYLLVNPKYKNEIKSYEDFISGDVILSRGGAYSSAAIARIGENDFQFSHISMIYRDQNDFNKMYTTEAHIEIGAVVAPFEMHLNEKNTRSVVFRYRDSKVAAKASEYIFKKVKEKSESGKNYEYDFSMNYKEDSRLFCSEIISSAFHHINPSEDYIPKYKTHFTKGEIPFLNNIGIPVTTDNIESLDVFAPGDIQFDPQFDLIMEWRNPKKLTSSRLKDFILTKLFEKMETEGYHFDPTLKMDLQAKTFWLLRRTPLVKNFLEKKIAANMSPIQMEMFMSLDKVGELLMKEIERNAIEADHTLTPKEIYSALDEFLIKDNLNPNSIIKKFFRK